MSYKYVWALLIATLLIYIAFEAARTYHYIRVSAGLVAEAQPFEQANGDLSMLVIGDSTAVGVGADTPADTVAGYLSHSLSASVENHAVSGAVTADMAAQLAEAQKPHYDLILIQVGANDVIRFHSVEETNALLGTLLKEAKGKSDHIVLLTGGKIGEAPLFPWFVAPFVTYRAYQLRAAFMATAAQYGVAYVDLYSMNDNFNSDPQKYYAPDGLHLTAAGWHFWYEAALQTIQATWPSLVHA